MSDVETLCPVLYCHSDQDEKGNEKSNEDVKLIAETEVISKFTLN